MLFFPQIRNIIGFEAAHFKLKHYPKAVSKSKLSTFVLFLR